MSAFSVLALETISGANAAVGVTVVTGSLFLTNTAEYALVSCDLGMTARKVSALGGASPYTDVPVELTVHVIGTTAARCAQAMERLVTLIAQARRWENRENVDGVRLRMRLQGGTSDYACMLLGPEENEPPTSFVIEEVAINSVNVFMVRNVTLRFIRRGLLYKTAAQSGTSAATGTKEVGSCTFATSSDIPVPTSLTILRDSVGSTSELPGYLIVAVQNGIQRLAASNFIGAGTSTAESAANRPIGANIRRFTGAGTASADISANVSTWMGMAVLATVRPNSAGATWTVAASLFNDAQQQPAVPVTYRDGNAQVLFLGTFAGAFPGDLANSIQITVAGSVGTFDIESVYLVRTDLPAYIISPRTSDGLGMKRWGGFVSGNPALIDPRDHLDRQAVAMQVFYASGAIGLIADGAYDYNGDIFITSSGNGLAFAVIENGTAASFGANTAWREGDSSSPYTPYKDTVIATRYLAALTPQ